MLFVGLTTFIVSIYKLLFGLQTLKLKAINKNQVTNSTKFATDPHLEDKAKFRNEVKSILYKWGIMIHAHLD